MGRSRERWGRQSRHWRSISWSFWGWGHAPLYTIQSRHPLASIDNVSNNNCEECEPKRPAKRVSPSRALFHSRPCGGACDLCVKSLT